MQALTFLLDVDNTLLDNDRLKVDLARELEQLLGREGADQFWSVYEAVRRGEEYVDFPETLVEFAQLRPDLPQAAVRSLIDGISFTRYLFPNALRAVEHLNQLGRAVIVSDGDQVFQMRKIRESGLWTAVDGRVVLTIHKQREMNSVLDRFPAQRYVLVDDKTSILADIGRAFAGRIITVLVRQGKYARLPAHRDPDIDLPHVADLMGMTAADFLAATPPAPVG